MKTCQYFLILTLVSSFNLSRAANAAKTRDYDGIIYASAQAKLNRLEAWATAGNPWGWGVLYDFYNNGLYLNYVVESALSREILFNLSLIDASGKVPSATREAFNRFGCRGSYSGRITANSELP